jgi:hypothetical protein
MLACLSPALPSALRDSICIPRSCTQQRSLPDPTLSLSLLLVLQLLPSVPSLLTCAGHARRVLSTGNVPAAVSARANLSRIICAAIFPVGFKLLALIPPESNLRGIARADSDARTKSRGFKLWPGPPFCARRAPARKTMWLRLPAAADGSVAPPLPPPRPGWEAGAACQRNTGRRVWLSTRTCPPFEVRAGRMLPETECMRER